MTMQQLLWQGVQELNKAGVPDPELDARYLLLEVFHLNLASFLAMKGRELEKDKETEAKCREFRRLIEISICVSEVLLLRRESDPGCRAKPSSPHKAPCRSS